MRHSPEVRSVRNATRVCLAFIVPLVVGRAIAYAPIGDFTTREPPPISVRLISAYIPLDLWAALWAVAAVCLIIGVASPRIWTTIPTVLMCAVWSVAYGAAWASGRDVDGYLTASIYACVGGLIFAGNFLAGRALALSLKLIQMAKALAEMRCELAEARSELAAARQEPT